MKKITAVLCVLAVALGFSGCRVEADNNTESNTMLSTTIEESTTEMPSAKAVAGVEDLSVQKVVWGFGKIENHAQPSEPLSLQEKYSSLGGQWFVDGDKNVCLTFDEGYENGYTSAILDVLKEKNVKAIFFVTYDFASSNGELIQRMIDEGHTVGNHSYRHYSMDELDTETAREEVVYLHDYIKDNYTMSYFRFPKGEFSEKSLGIVNELGYKSVFWSYAYADWDTDNQPEENAAFTGICESTHPGEILLLHAVSETNANILGKVIDDIRKQGYEFTTEL